LSLQNIQSNFRRIFRKVMTNFNDILRFFVTADQKILWKLIILRLIILASTEINGDLLPVPKDFVLQFHGVPTRIDQPSVSLNASAEIAIVTADLTLKFRNETISPKELRSFDQFCQNIGLYFNDLDI
jgi:hypothetical protein